VLNLTGPETLSVRDLAMEFGRHFGVEPTFLNDGDGATALLSDASQAGKLFGTPTVTLAEMIECIAGWIQEGGASLNKPTHFQTRDGKF
jgi:hypothetical protein